MDHEFRVGVEVMISFPESSIGSILLTWLHKLGIQIKNPLVDLSESQRPSQPLFTLPRLREGSSRPPIISRTSGSQPNLGSSIFHFSLIHIIAVLNLSSNFNFILSLSLIISFFRLHHIRGLKEVILLLGISSILTSRFPNQKIRIFCHFIHKSRNFSHILVPRFCGMEPLNIPKFFSQLLLII